MLEDSSKKKRTAKEVGSDTSSVKYKPLSQQLRYLEKYDEFKEIEEEIALVENDINKVLAKGKQLLAEPLKVQLLKLNEIRDLNKQKNQVKSSAKLDLIQQEIDNLKRSLQIDSEAEAQKELVDIVNQIKEIPSLKIIKLKEANLRKDNIEKLIQLYTQLSPIKQEPPKYDISLELKQLLEDQEINDLEEAIKEKQSLEAKINKLRPEQVESKSGYKKTLAVIDRILEIYDAINKEKNSLKHDQNFNNNNKNQDQNFGGNQLVNFPEVQQKVLAQSYIEQNIEDARLLALYTYSAPDSIEKHIYQLIYLLFKKQEDNKSQKFDETLQIQTDQYDTCIINLLDKLKSIFYDEDLYKEETIQRINQLQQPLDTPAKYQELIYQLKYILQLIMKFNFQEFFAYMDKIDEAAIKLEGKEIILLLGTTGSGKSTTVHFLCGSDMIKVQVNGLNHITFKNVINQDLNLVKVSPFSRSETRYIRPITIDKKDLGFKRNQKVILVDTPGLFDLGSAEIDVSNQVGIVKGLSYAAYVQPIIVLSYLKMGARGEELKKILNFYAQMISDMDYIINFSFFFTHFPEESNQKELTATVDDILDKLTDKEKLNTRLVKFLEVISDKGTAGKLYILNPLNKDSLLTILNSVTDSQKIPSPREVFQNAIQPESHQKIAEQLVLHEEQIIYAFKRAECQTCKFKLNELLRFLKIFESNQDYKLFYDSLLQKLNKILQVNFDGLTSSIQRQIQHGNTLGQIEVTLINSNLQYADSLEPIRQEFLEKLEKEKQIKTPSYQELLIKIQEIIQVVYDNQNFNINRFDNNQLFEYFEKLSILAQSDCKELKSLQKKIFESFIFRIQSASVITNKLIDELITFKQDQQQIEELKDGEQMIKQNQDNQIEQIQDPYQQIKCPYEKFAAILNGISNAAFSMKDNSMKSQIKKVSDCIRNQLIKKFNQLIAQYFQGLYSIKVQENSVIANSDDEILETLVCLSIKPSFVNQIIQFVGLIEKFTTVFFKQQRNQELIKFLDEQIIIINSSLIFWYNVSEEKLKRKVSKQKKYSDIKKVYHEIMLVQELPFIQGQTILRYNRMKMYLKSLVENKNNEANIYLKQIQDIVNRDSERSVGITQISFQQLVQFREAIRTIKELQWTIKDGEEDYFNELKESLKNDLTYLILVIQDNVKNNRQESSSTINIKEADQAFHQIMEIQKIAFILEIELANFNIDEYKPGIEAMLKGAEKFLIKKQIIKIEEEKSSQVNESKIDPNIYDNLLKRSECERLDNFVLYLSQIKKKETMLKTIYKNDETVHKEMRIIDRVNYLAENMKKFIDTQLENVKIDVEKNIQNIKKYSENGNEYVVNQYGQFDQKQHEDAMNQINIYLVRPVENLVERFKMIKELKTKYPVLWSKLSQNEDYDDDFKTMISNYFRDLEQKIAITQGNAVSFFKNLRILKHIIPLDSYVHEDGQRIFQNKYDVYFKIMCNFSGQVMSDAEKYITENNFDEIKRILDTLTKLADQDALANILRIKQKLRMSCKTLTKSVQKQCNSMIGNHKVDPQKAENLNETVELLKDMLEIFPKYVLDQQFDEATKQLENFNERMSNDFTIIKNSIENSIDNYRFTEAQNSINNQKNILNAFNYSSMTQDKDQNKIEQQRTTLDQLEQKLGKSLEKLGQDFDYKTVDREGLSDVDLSLLMNLKPRDILENLQKGINLHFFSFDHQVKYIGDKLEEAFSAKKQFITDSFIKGKKSGEDCLQMIKEANKHINMLHEKLRDKFKIEFEDLKNTQYEEQKKESKQIQGAIDNSNNDFRVINAKIEKAKFILDEECKKKLNKFYENQIKNTFELIRTDLKQVIEIKLPELWIFQDHKIVSNIQGFAQQELLKVNNLLKLIFDEIIKKITASFTERKQVDYPPSNISEVNKYLKDTEMKEVIMHFFRLQKTHQHILNEIIPNMMNDLENVILIAEKELIIIDTQFKEAIKSTKLEELKEVFEIIIYTRKSEISTNFLLSQEFIQEYKLKAQHQKYINFVKIAEETKKQNLCQKVIPILNKAQDEINRDEIINDMTRNNKKDREQFYNQLISKIQLLQESKILAVDLKEFKFDPVKISDECNQKIQKKIIKIIQDANYKVEIISDDITTQQLILLGIEIANLKCMQDISINQNFQSNKNQITLIIKKVSENIDLIKKNLNANIKSNKKDSKYVSKNLILLQAIAQNIEEFKDFANDCLTAVLATVEQHLDESTFLQEIVLILRKSPEGSKLIETHPLFIAEARAIWATKFNKQGIEYVLDNLLTNDSQHLTIKERKSLLGYYNQFLKEYEQLVEENIAPIKEVNQNLLNIKTKVIDLTSYCKTGKIDKTQKNKIPSIMAHLFSIWTIQDSFNCYQKMNKGGNIQDGKKYLLKPHAAQVISIFRVLGLGYDNIVNQDFSKLEQPKQNQIQMKLTNQNTMFDNLVQIKTGEGKSITLAIVTSIFALWGFEVSCACYSEYLSKRDYQAFKQLFEFLNIKDQIFYGTFNKICEDYINKDGQIRDLVLSKILKDSVNTIGQKKAEVPRILLIDEVDVFFSKEFYNKLYVPMAQIKHPKVSALLDYFYANKSISFNYTSLRAIKEYQECAQLFKPEYIGLLDEACKDIIQDSREFLKHSYVVKDGKIGYKDQDQISFAKSYGYKTIFAHYHHYYVNTNEKVTIQNLEDCKGIGIHCGQFSYAEIPLYFMLILGVTGTLDSLSEQENIIIKETFQIKNYTFAPSVYGINNLLWKELDQNRIMIRNISEFYNEIANEIKSKMKGNNRGNRSVIVFFKTIEKLKQFERCDQFKQFNMYQTLTEQCDDNEKEDIVTKATYSKMITLSTNAFGRGTDFICRDEEVETNGGVHVIQTFVSELMSEFVQIQGRTARQGNKGSFQMILLDSDLSEINIDVESQEYNFVAGDKLSYIEKKRDLKMKVLQKDDTDSIKQIKEIHNNSLKIRDYLVSGNSSKTKNISNYLVKINQGPPVIGISKPVKTMILMDATGSMSSLLNKAKNSVGIMYERAGKILEDHKMEPNLNMIQYACYRNYSNSPSELLEYSPWESKPANLRQFMEKITAHGGQGNEAVEIGFQHAVFEANNCGNIPLHQVFLIGDAPPNTRQEVDKKRIGAANKWKGTKFEAPVYWDIELNKLKQKGIPVYAFYVQDYQDLEASFKDIAARSSGQSQFLDVNSDTSQETLLRMFITIILEKIGKESGDARLGTKMANEYMNIYK